MTYLLIYSRFCLNTNIYGTGYATQQLRIECLRLLNMYLKTKSIKKTAYYLQRIQTTQNSLMLYVHSILTKKRTEMAQDCVSGGEYTQALGSSAVLSRTCGPVHSQIISFALSAYLQRVEPEVCKASKSQKSVNLYDETTQFVIIFVQVFCEFHVTQLKLRCVVNDAT